MTNSKSVTTVPVPVPDIFSDLEIIAIDILNSTSPTRVITCYSPPLTSSSQDNFDYVTRLTTCLDILSGVNASIILLGDFNLPSIYWFHSMLSPSVSNPDEVFIEFIERNAMQQLVIDNTRPSPNIQVQHRVWNWSLRTTLLQNPIWQYLVITAPAITIRSLSKSLHISHPITFVPLVMTFPMRIGLP